MLQIISIFVNDLLPVFGLLAVGFFFVPRLRLEVRTLNKLAYYVLLPAFIFDQFSDATISAQSALNMALFMTVAVLVVAVISFLVAWLLGHRGPMLAAFILCGTFPNLGFSLPIIQIKFGQAAMVSASIYLVVGTTVAFIICVLAATWQKGSHFRAILSALMTPAVITVVPAVAINLLNITLPSAIDSPISLLGSALIPIVLVALGGQLANMGRLRVGRDEAVGASLRLIAGPIMAFLLIPLFGLTGVERATGILQMSMPAGVNASLIALEHDLLPDFVTRTVLLSTLASAVTLSVVLFLI